MAALAKGRVISAVIEQSLDNCLLVRFNHGSKIFRGVLFDEKHSVVSRTSLHDQNVEASSGSASTSPNTNGGQTSSRTSTRPNASPSVRLYRNTSTTRRNNHSSNKLQVFTEFDFEESTKFNVDARSESTGIRVDIDGASDVSKDCSASHRSTRSKSRQQSSTKHNTSIKNTTLNQKAVRTQNGSKNLKGKGNTINDVVGMNSNLRSKINLKSRQVVSKNSKLIQSSKDHQLKSQSLKKTEVGSVKMSPQKEKLTPKKTSTTTPPSQDSMAVGRKRKMDSGTQTAHSCKLAKKHLLCDKTEISTQANINLDSAMSEKKNIATSELETQGNIEQTVNTEQELVGCARRAAIVLDDESANTKLDLASNTGKFVSPSSSFVLCDQQQTVVSIVSETESKVGAATMAEMNGSGEQNDGVDSEKPDEAVSTASDKQNNSSSATPVKRSARISEKRSRQQFGDEMFDESLWITTPTKSQKRTLGTGSIDKIKKAIAVVSTDDLTTKPNTLVQCTAGSTTSHSVGKVNHNNNNNNTSSRRVGARIKFTPLRTTMSTSTKMQRCTDTELKHYRVSVGDIVWGKVHGHPWWPARVLAVSGNALGTGDVNRDVHVAWFGSNTSSIMPSQGLTAFSANFKKRFRRNKRGPYRTAVHEAQAAAKARGEMRS